MHSLILAVAVDARDPAALARFWAAALARPEPVPWDDEAGATYHQLSGEPDLVFQPVPESKAVKNRLHLDLAPAGGTQGEEVERLTALGTTVVDRAEGFPWVVLADPEGNEFCVLPPRDADGAGAD